MTDVLIGIAIACVTILLLGWLVYPLWIRRGAECVSRPASGQTVSCVLATRERPELVAARVRNLLATDYPAELLDVVVTVDSRCACPIGEYEQVLAGLARVVAGDPPGGKSAALNAGVRAASGEIVLLVDTRQRFEATTIPVLLSGFDTGRYAAVSGVVALERDDVVMRRYWDYEMTIRKGQAARRGLVTTSGAITAVRRAAWAPLPAGAICDDLFLTIGLAQRGFRVGLVEGAVAQDHQTLSREDRLAKRVRTLTGLVQFIRWNPSALLPWRNPVWAHFYAHKVLRLATPYLLAFLSLSLALLAAPLAERGAGFGLMLLGSGAVVGLAMLAVAPARVRQFSAVFAMVGSLLAAPVLALANGFMGRWDVWTPSHPGQQSQ